MQITDTKQEPSFAMCLHCKSMQISVDERCVCVCGYLVTDVKIWEGTEPLMSAPFCGYCDCLLSLVHLCVVRKILCERLHSGGNISFLKSL